MVTTPFGASNSLPWCCWWSSVHAMMVGLDYLFIYFFLSRILAVGCSWTKYMSFLEVKPQVLLPFSETSWSPCRKQWGNMVSKPVAHKGSMVLSWEGAKPKSKVLLYLVQIIICNWKYSLAGWSSRKILTRTGCSAFWQKYYTHLLYKYLYSYSTLRKVKGTCKEKRAIKAPILYCIGG